MGEFRRIRASLGVVNGGIGINWGYLGLGRDEFFSFWRELLRAMGFQFPETVYWERNARDGRTNWNRLRICQEECQLHGVNPEEALQKAREWLPSEYVLFRYGLKFSVPTAAVG